MRLVSLALLISLAVIACGSSDDVQQNTDAETVTPRPVVIATVSDTTSIRIVTNSSEEINNLFQFDSTASGWKGTLYRYRVGANNTPEFVDIRNMIPKNGWDEFSDFVSFLDIFTIPDQSELSDFKPVPNPLNVIIQFELSRKGVKRTYAYANPGGKIGNHWTTDNISTFISYITSDFDFIRPN